MFPRQAASPIQAQNASLQPTGSFSHSLDLILGSRSWRIVGANGVSYFVGRDQHAYVQQDLPIA
jgi:hypothetical protein